ncbi:hypothetical protein PENTCL1PPCAC_17168, partial [Pristionchus entomophagus]
VYSEGLFGRSAERRRGRIRERTQDRRYKFLPPRFLSYSLVMFGIAFESLVALEFSDWYESGKASTLLVFLAAELLVIRPSLAVATLWTLELISHFMIFVYLTVFNLLSITATALNYFLNVCHLRRIGATFTNYTLSRTFQIRENIRTLKFQSSLLYNLSPHQ